MKSLKTFLITCLVSMVFLAAPHNSSSKIPDDVIKSLHETISKSTNPAEKAGCYVSLARWNINDNNTKAALAYLNKAIEQDDKPWMRAMRAGVALREKQYELALSDAVTAEKANPSLAQEVAGIKKKAKKKLSEQYAAAHPKNIIIDKPVNYNRLSRFDIARAAVYGGGVKYQGKVYRAKRAGLRQSPKKYTDSGTRFNFAMDKTKLYANSRLNGPDCGPRMSRLDAEECERIRIEREKYRVSKRRDRGGQNFIDDGNDVYDDDEKNDVGTIVSGGWDTKGRHYDNDGSGNAWRSDGTYMIGTGGGYINSKTGDFIPAN